MGAPCKYSGLNCDDPFVKCISHPVTQPFPLLAPSAVVFLTGRFTPPIVHSVTHILFCDLILTSSSVIINREAEGTSESNDMEKWGGEERWRDTVYKVGSGDKE